MNTVAIGVVAYIAIQFGVGAWVARRIRTERDYINAGRTLGPVLGAFTVFATWFGAEAIVGTGGEVYQRGLAGAESDPFGYSAALIIVGIFFAAALWRRGLTTFADFFRERYSPAVEKLVVLVLLPGSIFWAAAQIRAFGQIVSSVSDIDVGVATKVAAVLIVAYTVLGGLLADAINDFVHGITVIVGLGLLAILASIELGGLSASLAAVPVERLTLVPIAEASPLEVAERWAVPIGGTIVAVELISRILGCRSAAVAARATVTGGLLYLAVGLIPVYIGLVAPQILSTGLAAESIEQVVPEMAAKLMPDLLFVLFAGALISAILSTIDSVLLSSASQVSHNIFVRMLPSATEKQKLLSVRLTVVALAAVAYGIAHYSTSIRDLVEVAAAAGSTGVLVSLVIGMNSNFGGTPSAIAALAVGTTTWLTGYLTEMTSAPYLLSVAAATVAYVLVAFAAPAANGSR